MRWQPGQRWCRPLPGARQRQRLLEQSTGHSRAQPLPFGCCPTTTGRKQTERKRPMLSFLRSGNSARRGSGRVRGHRSEALLLCSFAAPSREEVGLRFRLLSMVRGFKWNPKGYQWATMSEHFKMCQMHFQITSSWTLTQPLSVHGRPRRSCDLPVVTRLVSEWRGQD